MPPPRLVVLAADLAREAEGTHRLAAEMETLLRGLPETPTFLEVRAAGSILHDFYTSAERAFRHIAVQVDGELPRGDDWHVQLLRRMATEIHGLRPPVITATIERDLEQYLRFRHLFRNIYGFDLKWELLQPLARRLIAVEAELRSDLQSFAAFLSSLSRE